MNEKDSGAIVNPDKEDDDGANPTLNRLAQALERHIHPNDKLGHYDALLGVIGPPVGYPRMSGGYKLWPERVSNPALSVRLMSIGNSTGLWPGANWSQLVAEALTAEGYRLTLYHGAGKGSTSSQDVLRVLRDAPAIKPALIFSLSGITDIGYLLLAKNNPFSHKYTRRAMDFLKDSGMVSDVAFGLPHRQSPAASWCQNQRMMRVMADEIGARIVTFLQPVQGFGAYDMTEAETAFLAAKSKVILQAMGKPYGECVTEFYEEVKAIMAAAPLKYDHIIDFTDVFADCPGAYRDHRHQNEKGVAHLAARMLPVLRGHLEQIGAPVAPRPKTRLT
ncbi:MAG: hypothetical protein JNN06_12010 [Gemmobacter sp.]|uniref:hypothetical protein n=1 Tax=Gemmobacter sp. TaxID=1898957 RepID=UPI001A5C10B2|nr:hypothetical protein [Gemmobacter sp.]MBL8562994.1 hypothetical protein [Gemmobacter sp.]